MASLKAIVKSVISGDSIVLRNRTLGPGQPSKERILHIADISAPRMGTSTREDEAWAFDCRENLRKMLVGKEVSFTPTHALPPSNTDADVQRDVGTVEYNGVDLATDLLRSGWARTKELSKREPTEEDSKRREVENEAKQAGRGIWRPEGPPQRTVHNSMPADSQAFIKEWKDQMIDGIVEQVRDGSTVRVRLLLSDELHQLVTISLAGIRCPRIGKEGETPEPFAEDARFFTESRLLQRLVRVKLLSLPAPSATPFGSASSGPPPPATMFIGIVIHPVGNVAEHLVANGLAKIIDWHAGMLAAGGFMERLRAAESTAKEKKQFLYAQQEGAAGKARPAATAGSKGPAESRTIDGQVIRVWSADTISIAEKDTGKERRVQLSSTRAPKTTDPKQKFYASEAKEFLRKKLIGKTVHARVDFVRPQEGNFEERECVTIRFGNNHTNVAEMLIDKGLASVVWHKRDDEDRSPDYDKLMAAEQTAINEKRGLHSGKEGTVPNFVNASETLARATQFLSGFKRQKRVSAIVDYVAAGSRFKLIIPRDNVTLTFVLAGIRAPKTARREDEKSEPYGQEAADFATRHYMQRDVEVEFEAVDKSGGFIGAMYLNKENAALALVKEGLATVHAFSAESLAWSKQLTEAEQEAKQARKNIWADYVEEEETSKQETDAELPSKVEYIDVLLSDIRTDEFGFSIQILNTEGIASLEKLMVEFAKHYQNAPTPPGFVPKTHELISAKFSDGQWYRAKVRRASPAKREAEVTFIDYGNRSVVPFAHTRPLEPKFKSLPAQAHDARLSFVKMVAPTSEYYEEAVARFRNLCEERKLIANIDYKEGGLLHLRLIDPSDPASKSGTASINADLVREGYATIDRKGTPAKYASNYPAITKILQDNLRAAKTERAGMFEYGNVDEDDD
ncbi:hypothetical protein FRC14_006340 [Serendipita sp. 396]|nr:hypothetical protein FRC14_006340 [Serendipita sp. 396]KAG8787314.1 hypothetical protein FRC15_009512 [Serendipita sp. 397]KAG8802445.1 hypothetical protein FRC16_009634 [Serendipita sp. 398]KAG8825943.1 hypothetical protein FRC19_010120 [Serendipita sp. 401]KAG8838119.1 hypothetical protein FRC18_006152 [Serendipita sp. 400]KAG8858898.1 hypothetical protein FRB91_009030 [Serendipita sp. 411]KAG8872012.1 hypothetical protein FRC20_009911 [Serendipita sp. 405]KAG9056718.1 hypothetical prot